jgi:Transposase DDE domain
MVQSLNRLCVAIASEGPTMRHDYCTLTPAAVRSLARAALAAALPWQPFRRSVPVAALLDLVLLTAALGSSLWAVVRRFAFGFSHETARRALDANLPEPDELADGLVNALHGFLPRVFRRRAWDVALDRHDVPFYGQPGTPGVLGGPKKGGTNRAFAYATAVVVHQGQRWCLGLARLTDNDPEAAVLAVLAQLQVRGVRLRSLLLDRGFFSGHVIRALQERGVPFVLGVPRKGGRWDRLFALPSGRVAEHAWRTERGRHPVSVPMVRACRRVRGHWRREVYAFGGVSPAQAVGRYARARFYRERQRRRFGIETSYRQLNQGKALTTSTDARRRLLWRGVALLLRQAWVWCQYRLARRGTNWRYWQPDERLRLAVLLEWLAGALKECYPASQVIPLPQPLPLPFTGAEKR